MLHLHNLHHVQVGLGRSLVDGQHGINDIGGQLRSQCGVELRGEGCSGDVEQQFAVDLLGQLEGVEELAKQTVSQDKIHASD